MTNVQTLLQRTVASLTEHGYKPHFVNHTHEGAGETPEKTISVEETFRMNHSMTENVTVSIVITKWDDKKESWLRTGKTVAEIKVPKDASERVLENRVVKAIAAYNEA